MSLLAKQGTSQAQVASTTTFRPLNAACTLLVVLVGLVLFSTPLRQGPRMLAYAQDDFYYYLTIARNVATGHGSTFDGSTITNGYHPLYFVLLLGVEKINTSLRAAYTALWFLDIASALVIFVAVRTLVARRVSNAMLSNGFALAIVALSALRIMQQMEVTLAMPLGLLLLVLLDRAPRELTPARWAGVGFVASLVVLSRLDSVFLVLLCVLLVFTQRAHRRELSWTKVACFALAFFPLLLVYLATNEHFYHRLTPISGVAKQLRHGVGLFFPAIRDSFSAGSELMIAMALAALCLLPKVWRELSPQLRVVCTAMLLFPFVQLGTNLLLSDWMLFPWYRYSLIFSTTAVAVLAAILFSRRVPVIYQGRAGVAVLLLAFVGLLFVRYVPDQMMSDIADAAFFIRSFARTHPGRYAMGDRAGMVGYIDGVPTVQMEGLVMDDRFLNYIREEGDIGDVLKRYGVDYYIAFDWRLKHNWPQHGCFLAKEPNHAGPSSPALMDDFCDPPVAEYMRPTGRTIIFDVRGDGERDQATAD